MAPPPPPPPVSSTPVDMSTSVTPPGGLGVAVMQTIAGLLSVIMEHTGNLKGLSGNQVLGLWPSHFQQFGFYVTEMSDLDTEVLQIDSKPREKALQAAAEEKVSLGELGIWQGLVSEANCKAIDLSTFKVKDILSALSLLEEATTVLDVMELRSFTGTSSVPPDPSTLPGIIPRQPPLLTLASGTSA